MPEMNFAVPSSPIPVAVPPAASGAGGEPSVQGPGRQSSSEGAEASFARVLKQQMSGKKGGEEGKTPANAPPPAPEILLSTEATVEAPAAEDLASLLPMLLGNAISAAPEAPQEEAPALPALASAPEEAPQAAASAFLPTTAADEARKAVSLTPADPADPTGPTMPASPRPAAIPAAAPAAENATLPTEKAASAKEQPFETLLASREQAPQHIHSGPSEARQAGTPAPAAARMGTPMGAPGWNTELGEKLVWMVSRQDSRADLVLNPPHLGRVEVSLTVNGDQASALFVSANPAVRDSLENALPRLREILLDAGITLGQAQVGTESPGQSAGNGENGDNGKRGAGHAAGRTADDPAASEPAQWVRRGNGLVDVFA